MIGRAMNKNKNWQAFHVTNIFILDNERLVLRCHGRHGSGSVIGVGVEHGVIETGLRDVPDGDMKGQVDDNYHKRQVSATSVQIPRPEFHLRSVTCKYITYTSIREYMVIIYVFGI